MSDAYADRLFNHRGHEASQVRRSAVTRRAKIARRNTPGGLNVPWVLVKLSERFRRKRDANIFTEPPPDFRTVCGLAPRDRKTECTWQELALWYP